MVLLRALSCRALSRAGSFCGVEALHFAKCGLRVSAAEFGGLPVVRYSRGLGTSRDSHPIRNAAILGDPSMPRHQGSLVYGRFHTDSAFIDANEILRKCREAADEATNHRDDDAFLKTAYQAIKVLEKPAGHA